MNWSNFGAARTMNRGMNRGVRGRVWAAGLAIAFSGVVSLGAVAPAWAGVDEPAIRLRGTGSTREALNATHLKPFDRARLSMLSDWIGTAPTPESLDGKVVVIVTWASWYPVSTQALAQAQKLQTELGSRGLVTFGVHNPRGFDKAQEKVTSMGVTLPVAADKDGKFRKAMLSDQDPNVYVIDRSGNMRYAQVDVASLREAVEHLLGETAEEAKSYPTRLAERKREAEKSKWKTSDRDALPSEVKDVEFTAPEEEEYKKANWPYMVGKVEVDKITEKVTNDSPKLTTPEDEFIPAKPKMAGRIGVWYLVDPALSDMLNVIPVMNRLVDVFPRDMFVCGAMFKSGVDALKSGSNDDESKLKERNTRLIKELMQTRSINHPFTPAVLKADNLEFNNDSLRIRISSQREQFGVVVLTSTDGRIRWIGNPYSEDMKSTLQKLIEVDPGVQARRKAEKSAGK